MSNNVVSNNVVSGAVKGNASRALGRIVKYVLLAGAIVVSLFPFYWMLRMSLSPVGEVFMDGIELFPSSLNVDNYVRAWNDAGLGTAIVNGLIVTLGILSCQLITCVPAAFALAKFRFRGANFVLTTVLLCLLVPTQATMVPMFIGINLLGITDTRLGMIVPFMTSVVGIFLIRQQVISIPDSLLDAAKADGLGPIRTLLTVVVPLAKPSIAAFSVLSIFSHWNDYLWPLLVARSPEISTPPLALAVFQNADLGYDFAALAAAAVIVTTPVLILFLFAQKQFVRGMSGTEVAG